LATYWMRKPMIIDSLPYCSTFARIGREKKE
jgi:hypothetical protein